MVFETLFSIKFRDVLNLLDCNMCNANNYFLCWSVLFQAFPFHNWHCLEFTSSFFVNCIFQMFPFQNCPCSDLSFSYLSFLQFVLFGIVLFLSVPFRNYSFPEHVLISSCSIRRMGRCLQRHCTKYVKRIRNYIYIYYFSYLSYLHIFYSLKICIGSPLLLAVTVLVVIVGFPGPPRENGRCF